jgi:hydrogenase/urease accessory protein HupE
MGPESAVATPVVHAYQDLFLEGVAHILWGADHLVFLLAMLLICRRVSEAVWAVTGFTIGHSVSLALAVSGVIQPNAPAIEAAIGLTIVLVIVERSSNATDRALPGPLAVSAALLVLLGFSRYTGDAWQMPMLLGMLLFAFCYLLLARDHNQSASFRLLATALFGLIHGLGFAGAFLAIEMPVSQLAFSLLAFNLGVEIGQLLLVMSLALVWSATRAIRGLRPLIAESLAATALGMGIFWFVTRLFGQ